jgi:hypothetical protein
MSPLLHWFFVFRLCLVASFYNLWKSFLWKLNVLFFTILISVFFEWFLAFFKSTDLIMDDLITTVGFIVTYVTEVLKQCNHFSGFHQWTWNNVWTTQKHNIYFRCTHFQLIFFTTLQSLFSELYNTSSSSSSSCAWRIRCVSCFLILKMKLLPPSLPRSSYVPLSFWFIL